MELDHAQPYIIKIRNLLSSDECQQLINRFEADTPSLATVNTVHGAQVRLGVRNNERVMFTDFELATMLFQRAEPHVPGEIQGLKLVGVNELFRCYRYKPGMRFAPHPDGAFRRNECEQSCFTFMVYLNDDFEGGHTTFLVTPEVSVKPLTGMALFFQHPLIHEGSLVTKCVKYVLRTDVMYRKLTGD